MMEKNERKSFYIPKVEEETISGGSGVVLDHFVSSISGYNTKDTVSFHHAESGASGRYDAFRSIEERRSIDSRNVSPDKKYDPNRIPSYLRREEPAISRNNIDYLLDQKLDEKTLYSQNRERYRKYSEIKNSEEKAVTRSVINQESPNPRKDFIKPTRNERSTLVITSREERAQQRRNEAYSSAPYQSSQAYNEPQRAPYEQNYQVRQAYNEPQRAPYEQNYQPRPSYNEPQRAPYEQNYQSEPIRREERVTPQYDYEPTYQDNRNSENQREERMNPSRYNQNQNDYQERPFTRNINDNPNQNASRPSDASYREEKTNVFQTRIESIRRQNDFQQKNQDKEFDNRQKEKRPSFITLEDDNENYYSDISIGLSEEKEIESLDEYDGGASFNEIKEAKPKRMVRRHKYVRPPLEILRKSGTNVYVGDETTEFQKTAINSTLEEFNIGGRVVSEVKGPTVTQFEVKLDPGIKVNKVEGITRNLQMNLASNYIRMEAPIPGRNTIGIEVPNQKKSVVALGDLLDNPKYLNDGKPLNIVLGRGVSGEARYCDIREMPHALVAGATGSGKTICIYSIIMSILYKARPDEVKLMLVDPKRNELIFFENVPHLACPIIDEPKVATAAIKWAVDEMERRYELFKPARSRTIDDYNEYVTEYGNGEKLPYIVIIIDEFADLMNTAGSSFEINVQRLCQKARSAGIHLLIATQRPSVEVIKGTIKANIQTRIALCVKSTTDSITILDHVGAEKLLGKGDMLFSDGGNDIRIQGAYVSIDEINAAVDSISTDNIDYMFTLDELEQVDDDGGISGENGDQIDEMLVDIARFVVKNQIASMNQMIRMFNIGYNRIDTIMDNLQNMGIVSSAIQGKPRSVLVSSEEELEEILRENNLI